MLEPDASKRPLNDKQVRDIVNRALTWPGTLESLRLHDCEESAIIAGRAANAVFYCEGRGSQPDTLDRQIADYWSMYLQREADHISRQAIRNLTEDLTKLSISSRSSYPIHAIGYTLAMIAQRHDINLDLANFVETHSDGVDAWVKNALDELAHDLRCKDD